MAPLRERPGDVPLLARYFLDLAAAKYGKNMSTVTPEAMTLLSNCDWPGNVRQLEHLIDQIVITNNSAELTADMLPAEISTAAARIVPARAAADEDSGQAVLSIEKMEKHLILRALELTSGSVREAARQLGLSEATLYRKMKKFGISRTFSKPQ
jgi:transcriptional regulator with PAS, ATPase and Fis domain